MRILVTSNGEASLVEPDDFKRFSIALEGGRRAQALAGLAAVARIDGDHAWIGVGRVAAMAPAPQDPDWRRGFEDMLAYASRKGWMDETNALRAHIEEVEPASGNVAISTDHFRDAMRNLAGGVAVLASGASGERRGMTITALSSVTADPPSILVCVHASAEAHAVVRRTGCFSVNLLKAEDQELAMIFAGQRKHVGEAKFHHADWIVARTGAPVLRSALVSMECKLRSEQRIGTHSVFVGTVVGARVDAGDPLVNFRGRLQTVAQSAPAYAAE